MTNYRILYTSAAKNDLKDIYKYIAFELKERPAAENVIKKIRNKIRKLDFSPERYPAVEWKPWSDIGMRKLPVANYLVFFFIVDDTKTVMINRILYGGRNIESLDL